VDSARWLRIDRVFAGALERPAENRSAYLDRECGDDIALRHEVESLLAQDLDDDFLAAPASGEAAVLVVEAVHDAAALRFTPGQVLGNRFRIRGELGSGGMGRVWHAEDLKLRVDVALKAMRPEVLASWRAVEALRREVRAAREVVSPNVCRVFDLVELEGHELLSMEYVGGTTLSEVLAARAPLPLDEAQDIASQMLAGLEAIHAAGLVHRDVKPSNVMVTPAGRVVVMDFGIARAAAAGGALTLAGTPAYMAPELLRGEAIDARADVYAAGRVLTEMVAPAGASDGSKGRAQSAGGPSSGLAETPWAPALRRALAPSPEDRYPSAAALARALEEVARRTTGGEGERPYPGLACFSTADAEFFFGRELEIEEAWRRIGRSHLLALVGPSGAGKSSFLRAGLVASAPSGWRMVVASPGDRPFAALARALAPELSGDVEAVARLVDFGRVDVAVDLAARWRRRHEQAALVVDQLEELFTQAAPAVQERFTELLARLALDADVHVLLALRDDFLFQCHRFPALAPVFSELMPLGPPTGDALRRALVQPALRCGYRFEDEGLVDALLEEVGSERGALPLVAFTMARLWDLRDGERGLLTREAYERIGGVAGALAGHAEETLERIGRDRAPVVRELFRNLVTAQGTRATVARDELLSVFDGGPDRRAAGRARVPRAEAARILDTLVAARLLTAYELAPEDEGGPGSRRVEVVHESLLASWPRLVRWRAQDEQGALQRDQLRQAARLWEERGRPEDLLWTGTSFREHMLWREQFAGGLTETEERFARAMTARNQRQRRRRRAAAASVLLATVVAASAMGLLWRRSELARAGAVTAAERTAAEQFSTLAQLELERNPTASVAYALASLERRDTTHARRLALRALWRGPTAFELVADEEGTAPGPFAFSPDGRWLLAADGRGATSRLRLWRDDGTPLPQITPPEGWENLGAIEFSGDSRMLVVTGPRGARVYSVPELEQIGAIGGPFRWGAVRGRELITGALTDPSRDGDPTRRVTRWSLPRGEPLASATWVPLRLGQFRVDPRGRFLLAANGADLHEWPLADTARPPRVLRTGRNIFSFVLGPDGERVYTFDDEGTVAIWSRTEGTPLPGPRAAVPFTTGWTQVVISADGHTLARANGNDERLYLWDLAGPVDGDPLILRRDTRVPGVALHPAGSWLAAREDRGVTLWPLARRYPRVLRGPEGSPMIGLTVDPRGGWVATGVGHPQNQVWLWPLRAEPGKRRLVFQLDAPPWALAVSPRGDLLAAGTHSGVWLVPLDGRAPEKLPGFAGLVRGVAFDREGRRLAAGGGLLEPSQAMVRIWDLETRQTRVLDPGDGKGIGFVQFLPDGSLLSAGHAGVRSWNLGDGSSRLILPGAPAVSRVSPDGRHALGLRGHLRPGGLVGEAVVHDLATGRSWPLTRHGGEVTFATWDGSGRRVVTGSRDGTVRIGPMTGEEPHLLLGHERSIWDLAVETRGRWLVSTSEDGTARLWPMPGGRPLQTWPRGQLLARLRSLTNYRAQADPGSPSGYRLAAEPFAGWRGAPPAW
jgi:WD40 repeat protein